MNKTIQYFKEVRVEMEHVTWPTRTQTIQFTVAVLVVSLFIAYFLGLFDKLFTLGIERLLNR